MGRLMKILKPLAQSRGPQVDPITCIPPLVTVRLGDIGTRREQKQKGGNYRPISLTLVAGKILESIIKVEITQYLDIHDKIGRSEWFCEGKILPDESAGVL